ncbi:S24 family peptidase [Paramuribaculum intestinale]|uniref:S24 family peptidase n=1 Tax=Paramuribaculum intestinale TaxID=2094151 RepID=UPI002732E035|nr:S24 family peptidase [Paramuribaculum intestinale]
MLKQTSGADGDPSRASKDLDTGSIDRTNPGATRPRIPFTAAAGALSIATNAACDADCERFPVITTFPAYDFTIKIEGDSMAPDYLSGDELACRFVDYPANIKWGEPHILDTRDGVVFKIPYFGGDQIMCRSINPDGPSFLVDCADVLHVASIVGFTRQLQP